MNYTEYVAAGVEKKQYVNGTHEFVLPKLNDNKLKRARMTPLGNSLVHRVENENNILFEEAVEHQQKMDEREEKRYYVSLRAQKELESWMAGETCPISKERHEMLQKMKMVADREDVSLPELVNVSEAVPEALECSQVAFLPEQEHNTLEKTGELHRELLERDQDELQWVDAADAIRLNDYNKREHFRRIGEWVDNQASLNEESFLLFAVIPELGIKINQVWTFLDGKRELCLWNSWTKARFHVFMKIVKHNNPSFLKQKPKWNELKNEVVRLCDEKGVKLSMSMCDMERQQRKVETKTLVFGVARALEKPTRYTKYSKEQDMTKEDQFGAPNGKFKRFILANADGVSPEGALTGYQLEEQVMRGKFDSEDLIAQTFEHPLDEEINDPEPVYEEFEMTEAIKAYTSFYGAIGRPDLIDAVMGVGDDKRVSKEQRAKEGKEVVMLPELAEAIWNGMFDPAAANELFGTFWNDDQGNLRRGAYLYEAFETLVMNKEMMDDIEFLENQQMGRLLKQGKLITKQKGHKQALKDAEEAHAAYGDDDSLKRLKSCKALVKLTGRKLGRLSSEVEAYRYNRLIARLEQYGFDPSHTSFKRVAKIVVNHKAKSLLYRWEQEAVFGQ